jgi:hypothetical protein
MWWFDGKGGYLDLRGQGFKPHKWCVCGEQW